MRCCRSAAERWRQVPGYRRAVRPLRRFHRARDFFGDFLAAAETGIDQAFLLKRLQRRAIRRHARRLAQHRFFPCQPQPLQILENRRHEFVPRPALIQILDPQQKARSRCRRHQRGIGMAQMQIGRLD